jgi:hypothetical protein
MFVGELKTVLNVARKRRFFYQVVKRRKKGRGFIVMISVTQDNQPL